MSCILPQKSPTISLNMEELEEDKSWDFRKILAVLILLIVLGFGFKFFVLNNGSKLLNIKSVAVQGAKTSVSPNNTQVSDSLKKGVESKINDLVKEVNQINVVEVATSTPAVQKVLNDIKSIQNLPQSQAKEQCLKICNGL